MEDEVKDKHYAYFFTRQDIFPEYQLVQTAHAALKLGVRSQQPWDEEDVERLGVPQRRDIDPDETYFTVIGVRDLQALRAVEEILDKFGFLHEVFVEPDIGNEETSIAVYPVHEKDRGVLMAFDLLRFKNKG